MKSNKKFQQELNWLLKHEVPKILKPLEASITGCLKNSLLKSTGKHKLTCVSSSSGSEALRGSVMLHKDTLCSMELFIKPSKTLSSIKASFRSDKQWKLQQIHDALNHLQKAGDVLSTITQTDFPHSPQGLLCGLDDVIKNLIKCQSRLVLPCQLTLQALIGSGFTKMFAPSLPGDALMNVFIMEDRLVVIHYTVQQAHTNASLNPSKNIKLNSNMLSGQALYHTVGSVLEHGSTRYEVSSASRSECVLPLLSNTLRTALNAQLQCQDLKDKLMTLKSGWGSFEESVSATD